MDSAAIAAPAQRRRREFLRRFGRGRRIRRPVRLDPHERWVLANADHFTACAFRGRGRYERAECRTIEEARRCARRLSTDRPAMIYTVYRRHQALVETVGPPSVREL